jgi:hypothetical protein
MKTVTFNAIIPVHTGIEKHVRFGRIIINYDCALLCYMR